MSQRTIDRNRYSQRRGRGLSALLCAAALTSSQCQRTPPSAEVPASTTSAPPQAQADPAPRRFEVIEVDDSADRWLFVEKTRDGADGGWATGSFDRGRNKLEIRTRGVRQFGLFLDRVPIDWEKLVVLSIDGKNSELRRRNHSRLHVQLDDYGQWKVLEP